MKILLDTCAFLWIITNNRDLTNHARSLFGDPNNVAFLSSVSSWEISIKYSLGKLDLPDHPEKYIPMQRKQHGIESLPLDEDATLYLSKLPNLHKDPFDRILICQAIIKGAVILTPDHLITQYPIRTEW